MKRVLPLLISVSILEIYFITFAGKWLFSSQYVNTAEITIVNHSTDRHKKHCIDFIKENKEYTAHLSETNYINKYKKEHQIKYCNAEGPYYWLAVIYILFLLFFGVVFVLRSIDLFVMYHSDYSPGCRFSSFDSFFSHLYSDFYNKIDVYDLTLIKSNWYQFWGYK